MEKFLPSLPQISRETIAVLAATVVAAWIISKFPPVQKLVRENSITLNF
jgi:hypothetical protein